MYNSKYQKNNKTIMKIKVAMPIQPKPGKCCRRKIKDSTIPSACSN